MILGFKQYFPDGTPTKFKQKIFEFKKIHSMREGDRWEQGMYIHMANGVRTKNYLQFNKGIWPLEKCKGTQRVYMGIIDDDLRVLVDDKYLSDSKINLLIRNDGLTRQRFIDWFFTGGKDRWSGQLIHWTDFKY